VSAIWQEVWTQIESSGPTGDELIGRQAAPDVTSRLLAAVDSRGRRHLLVSLEPADEAFRDASSRGLTVLTEDLSLGGGGNSRYINIACEEVAGHAMLDLIGAEIADRLRSTDGPPSETVARVLAKWRRFWGQLPRQLLTQEAQVGLFAELWFLTYWLIPAVGISAAAHMWRGPYGSRHDFERPGLSIEAKGTASTRGRIHKVNGIEQLQAPESGMLLFFSLRVREEAGANNTLPVLCHACRDLISQDADAEGLFETALIAAGYLPVHEEEYSKTRLRVLEELLFDTAADFPRITANSFSAGAPQGVEELDYTINLGTFDELIVARTPADALATLAASGS
jgi:hypothetical protein